MLPRPVDVVAARLGRGAPGLRRPRLVRVGRDVEAQHLRGTQRHPRVPVGRQVQPVLAPGPPVLHGLQRPQVQDRAVVPVRDRPDVRGVRRDLAAQMPQHRHAPGIEPGAQQHRPDLLPQVGDGRLVPLGHRVRVRARPQDVVAAGTERHQVGGQLLGPRHLFLHDLVQQAAADREVGVAELALRAPVRQQDRQPVRPADVRPVTAGIPDSLGEAVPDGCVRPDGAVCATAHLLRIVCHVRTYFTPGSDLRHRNQGLTWGD